MLLVGWFVYYGTDRWQQWWVVSLFDQLRARRSLCIVRTTLGVKFVLVLPITARPYLRILMDRNHVRNELFLFKKRQNIIVCACASDYIFSTESVRLYTCSIDGYCIKCWYPPSCNLGSPLHLFFCTFLRTVKHFISKCQCYHLENKVSLIMRLPDVGSSESCFDWLYNNPKAYTSLNWPTVHFFLSKLLNYNFFLFSIL